MKENEIVDKIKSYLKGIDGLFFWKQFGGLYGQSGLPDIICCYKGRFVGLEVKTEKGKISVLQEVTLRKIRNAGGVAEVARNVEDAKRIIQNIV
jgi:hypothetical protein